MSEKTWTEKLHDENRELRAEVERLTKERDELNAYLDAIASIPEVDAAEGGCDDAVRNALATLKAEVERLREALRGLRLDEWMTYEGNIEASGFASVDALEAARAALAGAPSDERQKYASPCDIPRGKPGHASDCQHNRRNLPIKPESIETRRALAARVREACLSADGYRASNTVHFRDAIRALDLDALLEER